MSPRARTVLGLAATLVAAPLLCLAGVALVGKHLAEGAPAEGHLSTPAERAARIAAERRAFLAMSGAQHLAAAEAAMRQQYRPARGIGGALGIAESHLDALADAAPEQPRAREIRAEIAARRARVLPALIATLRREARALDEPAPVDQEGRPARCHATAAMREETAGACIHDTGAHGTELVIGGIPCDGATIDALHGDGDNREALRRLGFRTLRCEHDEATRRSL